MFILNSSFQKRSPGGLLISPATTAYFRSKYFMGIVEDTYTSPIESIHCFDHFQSMYTQLLCGIYQRHDVNRVGASFAGILIMFINFFQTHFSEICQDIASGELSSKITEPTLRARLQATFMNNGPNIELAEFVNAACNGGKNWEGIIPKIWPNAKYLESRVTGSLAQYIPSLEFYGGGLPLVSHRYGLSECTCGVNLSPLSKPYCEASFTFIPNVAYFEFLPVVSEEGEQPDKGIMRPSHISDNGGDQVAELANVQIGQEYELLVTTYDGLYRYRVEDVLCPTGFYNSTPKFKVIRRKNVVLTIDSDKTTESELFKAIKSVSIILQPFNTMVLEYTSYVDVTSAPPHYVIYLELSSNAKVEIEDKVLGQCCLTMENCFSIDYQRGRGMSESIGPLEIRVVKNGSFKELRDYVISRGTSLGQYKVPRCLKLLPMVQLLDSCVISSHFSPSLPCSKF